MAFEVMSINDSRLAVECARTWRPDCMTLDMEMPGLDGLDVLDQIRADPMTRDISVFVVSVLATEIPFPAGMVQGVFTKPIKFKALAEAIRHSSTADVTPA